MIQQIISLIKLMHSETDPRQISLGGTLEQPSMALASTAEKTLASGLQNIIQTQMKGIQDDLKKMIASRVDKDVMVANGETMDIEKLVQGGLSSRLSSISLIPSAAPSKEKKGVFQLFK